MEREQFLVEDELYHSARQADLALHDLTVTVHDLGRKGLTGGKG